MKVVFLGCTDNFGLGFSANVTKIGYMAKGLSESGASCSIHNGIIGSDKIAKDQTSTVDGFHVTTLKKNGNQLISAFLNIKKIYKYLKQERDNDTINVVIVTMPLIHIYILYWSLCKILGYKYVTISHEWGPTLKSTGKIKFFLLCLYAKAFGWFCDAILPISEFIIEKISVFNKPYYKVPILAEFSDTGEVHSKKEDTFVYCASVYYKRVWMMLIDSYKIYADNGGKLSLILILNGPEILMENVQCYINNSGMNGKIIVKTKLPYSLLLNEYKKAQALIIPLNPSCNQDKARFSQKIAEYLSSKSAILTNKVGEINYYFKKNEIITCDYNEKSFADAFKWIEEHKDECKFIGENGYKRGQMDFNYKIVGKGLYNFFNSLQ